MKIYEYNAFPHPRRVRMFLAEKNIDVEYVQIDVLAGEHKKAAFLSKNPDGGVPFLELDNGTCISQTSAICRYFEDAYPQTPLMGKTPEEKATIEMWLRRIDGTLMGAVGDYFHHATDGLGDADRYRCAEWGARNLELVPKGFEALETHLLGRDFIVGTDFSLADINALCAIDFALFLEIVSLDDYPQVKRWYDVVSARPGASA